MFCDNVVHLIYQVCTFERDMCGFLLKIIGCKHFIIVAVTVPVLINMDAKTVGNIGSVVGDCIAIEEH